MNNKIIDENGWLSALRIRQVLAALIAGGVLLFLYRVRGAFTPFLLALLVVYLAHPLVTSLEEKEIPRPVAILLVYLLLAVLMGLAIAWLLPAVRDEIEQILVILPQQAMRWEGLAQSILHRMRRVEVPLTIKDAIGNLFVRLQQGLEAFAQRVVEITVALLSRIMSLIVAPIIAYYILRDRSLLRDQLLNLVPVQRRDDVLALLREINQVLNGFIRGQLIVSLAMAIMLTLGLSLIGVRYALLIGLMAGLFDLIPYFGPIIGVVPALLLASVQSFWKAVWVLVLFLAANQFEASVLVPKIMGDRVGLHPLVVIFALLAGGELFGVLGLLIAVPATAVGRVLVRFWWKGDKGKLV
ncbi:MAG: AI-2E family transporter [Firmicutes bacterium]|nr:AI-2E family transporter [Bacillota bacterium]